MFLLIAVTNTFLSFQDFILIRFPFAGLRGFPSSCRSILVVALLQDLAVFFPHITLFLLLLWVFSCDEFVIQIKAIFNDFPALLVVYPPGIPNVPEKR